MNAELILVTKTGIVNVYEIEPNRGNNFLQIVHSGDINYKIINLNPDAEMGAEIQSPESRHSIKKFRAVYLNGVRLVKNGRLIR